MMIERITPSCRESITAFIQQQWYTTTMIIRGKEIDMTQVEGFYVKEDGGLIGLITYLVYGDTLEITSLNSLQENRGIGSQLLETAVEEAQKRGCRRVVLITTNDNIRAIQFYQKRGFDMANLFRNALEVSRKLKPEIPLIGEDGIPLRHEIEFERVLTA